jgi:hypothetical protein
VVIERASWKFDAKDGIENSGHRQPSSGSFHCVNVCEGICDINYKKICQLRSLSVNFDRIVEGTMIGHLPSLNTICVRWLLFD